MTDPIADWILDTLGSDDCDSLAALYRRIDERLAAIEYNPLAGSERQAANLARNEARGILRAEFFNAGINLP